MIIKEQELDNNLETLNNSIYLLCGNDHYLLDQAAIKIKNKYLSNAETDSQSIHIDKQNTWHDVIKHANNYSLFAEQTLIDVRYSQKSFDSATKNIILKYLNNPNHKSLILIRAPDVPIKTLNWLEKLSNCLLISVTSLNAKMLQNWITHKLKQNNIIFDPQVPLIIQQHTQNNMLSCAQLIEKLAIVYEHESKITIDFLMQYLDDQAEYPIYELTDSILIGQKEKAIHRIKQAQHNLVEPILILWCLTQEIRQLIILNNKIKQKTMQKACQEIKIWPSKVNNYAIASKRLNLEKLYVLLQTAQQIDEKLKTYTAHNIWIDLEKLVILFVS